jgi:alpha-tubulin suppressor-like RCC1 family protein
MDDGTVACWGLDSFGALGGGADVDVHVGPVAVKGLTGVKAIEAGNSQTCAIDDTGRVWCWGSNAFGALANGHADFRDNPMATLTTENTGPMAAVRANGRDSLCGVLTSGLMECWGSVQYGVPVPEDAHWLSPTEFPGLTDVRDVALGDFYGCALRNDGTVWCWGSGPLGRDNGSPTDTLSFSETPLLVAGLSGVVEIGAGQVHACARLADGAVWCWGALGYGLPDSAVPVHVEALSGAVSLAASELMTCAVLTSGAVRCADALGPVTDVPGVAHATSVSVRDDTACAVIAGGMIKCWGDQATGLLGDGYTGWGRPNPTEPVTVAAPGSVPVPL